MRALQGLGVLVTRPEQQATPLCRLFETAGALAMRFPAIIIKPAGDMAELLLRLAVQEPFDLVIFTSANAVRFGMALLDPHRSPAIAAIGPATARALEHGGYQVTVCPAGGFDSERLLKHPVLTAIGGRRVLIIKGMRGRELLPEELTRRGARVAVAEVYRREPSEHDAAEIAAVEAKFVSGAIHVVTATSTDIVTALAETPSPNLRNHFARVTWLVPGARVAAALRDRGMRGSILQADSADDQDLVAALVGWRTGASGA